MLTKALRSRKVDRIIISCTDDSNQDEYYKGLIDSGTKMAFLIVTLKILERDMYV